MLCLLSEMTFFVMGANYWGQCYTVAVVFAVLAHVVPLHLPWGPLEFGAVWGVSLVVIGARLRGLTAADRDAKPASVTRQQ